MRSRLRVAGRVVGGLGSLVTDSVARGAATAGGSGSAAPAAGATTTSSHSFTAEIPDIAPDDTSGGA